MTFRDNNTPCPLLQVRCPSEGLLARIDALRLQAFAALGAGDFYGDAFLFGDEGGDDQGLQAIDDVLAVLGLGALGFG